MKILMVSSRIPYPLTAGFRIRIYNEAKYCRRAGHQVGLLYLGKPEEYERYKAQLAEVFHEVHVVPFRRAEALFNLFKCLFTPSKPFQVALYINKQLRKTLERLEGGYDVVIGNTIRTAEYLRKIDPAKTILDFHDAISYNYENAVRCTKGLKKWVYRTEYRRVLRYERDTAKAFRKAVIISEDDKAYLQKHGADTARLSVIPVAVRDDIAARKTVYGTAAREICFLGKMSYQPNEDAVVWFCHNVFPQLRERYPDVRFVIMGIEPSKAVCELERLDGVTVTGFLENPFERMAACVATVVPIRNGAGMQNKVLESMAVGAPTVLSPIAAEGLGGQNGVHYLAAERAEDYVEQLSRLLDSPPLCRQVGDSARELIRTRYTWEVLWSRWESLICASAQPEASDGVSGAARL